MKPLATALAAATLGASSVALAKEDICLDRFTTDLAASTEIFNAHVQLCSFATDPIRETLCINAAEDEYFPAFDIAELELEACNTRRLPVPPAAFD